MYDYLNKFTERVIKGTRAGELEKQQIAGEINDLLNEKPDDAPEEMAVYLQFLLALTKGENYDHLWEQLPDELKDLFGNAIKKFKGNDITAFLDELTEKVIEALKSGQDDVVESVHIEIDGIIAGKPDNGSEDVADYLVFLQKILSGESPEKEYKNLENNLRNIYDNRIQMTIQNDMMDFMNRITGLAFKARDNEDLRPEAIEQLSSLLDGAQQPPEDIAFYIEALIELASGIDITAKSDEMAMELREIFNYHLNQQTG